MDTDYMPRLSFLLIFFVLSMGESYARFSTMSRSFVNGDTISLPKVYVQDEWIVLLPEVFIWGGNPAEAAKKQAEWSRLRNAVYVTYPYARTAGVVMKDVLVHLENVKSKSDRKKYIKSREKELRDAFGDKIGDLSVYQGKVLMKLIHRQTGSDCYEIIKEMKGGLTARLYQTILFFVGSSLKQNWNPTSNSTDRLIESFVREMNQRYYPYDLSLSK